MITAYLKVRGQTISYRGVYYFMKEENIIGRKPEKGTYEFNHKKIQCDIPRSIFQTDFTHLWINKGWVYAFKVIDIFNREIVALEVSTFSGSITSEAILRQLVKTCISFPITLIMDNGSCYKASSYRDLAHGLNVLLSYTKAYTPEHNGVIERSWKTDKYEGLASFILSNDNIQDIFREWAYFYNTQRPHSTNKYKTPLQKLENYLKEHKKVKIPVNPLNIKPEKLTYMKIPIKTIENSPVFVDFHSQS